MSKIRAFIAAEVSPDVRLRARELTAKLSQTPAKVKWVAPENMHLTLKFLGDVEATSIPEVCQAVAEAVGELRPFAVHCRGAGAFPNASRPRTIWIGVDGGADQIAVLHKAIETGTDRRWAFPRKAAAFTPI